MPRKAFTWVLGTVIFTAAAGWFGPQAWRLVFPPASPVVIEVLPLPARASPPPTEAPSAPLERAPVVVEPLPTISVQKYRVDEAAELAGTLQRYKQTCEFWSARAADAAGRIFRDRACDQMRDYAKSTKQRVPVINKQHRVTTNTTPQPKPLRVTPRECTQHDYGSVRYRQCRAQESQRLKKMCQFHQQREERQQSAAWCAAYESYQIVK